MPQLDQLLLVYQSQWFWLAIVIAAIYFGIGKGMLPKIEATVDARDRQIAEDLAAAEQAHADADTSEEKLRDEMAIVRSDSAAQNAAAKAKAADAAAKRVAKADAVVDEKLAVADAALAKARNAAVSSIESIAAEAAQDIVTKVSGLQVTAAGAKTAVKAALSNG